MSIQMLCAHMWLVGSMLSNNNITRSLMIGMAMFILVMAKLSPKKELQ